METRWQKLMVALGGWVTVARGSEKQGRQFLLVFFNAFFNFNYEGGPSNKTLIIIFSVFIKIFFILKILIQFI